MVDPRKVYQTLSKSSRLPIILGSHLARATGQRFLQLRLDTNNTCNLRCKMCYFSLDSIRELPKQFMTLEEFSDLGAKLFPLCRRLYLSCKTEPLLSKHFGEFLQIAARSGVPFISFVTNGTALNEKNIDAIVSSNVNQVIISIDGHKKETVEGIRIGLHFERWIERIKQLSDAIKAKPGCRTRLRFNMVVMKSNIEEVLGVLDLAFACGVNELQLRALHSRNAYDYEYKQHIEMDMSDENAGIEEKLLKLKPMLVEKIKGMNFTVLFPVDPESGELKCSYPWFNHYIDSALNFYPCSYLPSVAKVSEVDSYAQLIEKAAPLMQQVKRDQRKECKECQALGRLYSDSELLQD